MSETDVQWLLRKGVDEIGVNFRTVWDLYLKFYAVFLIFNILAMAWLFGTSTNRLQGRARYLLFSAFIFQCLAA